MMPLPKQKKPQKEDQLNSEHHKKNKGQLAHSINKQTAVKATAK
jgi:hypothetical protein